MYAGSYSILRRSQEQIPDILSEVLNAMARSTGGQFYVVGCWADKDRNTVCTTYVPRPTSAELMTPYLSFIVTLHRESKISRRPLTA